MQEYRFMHIQTEKNIVQQDKIVEFGGKWNKLKNGGRKV